jgi:DeoR/GlpR family transcriptional regulator of sugar metabolism
MSAAAAAASLSLHTGVYMVLGSVSWAAAQQLQDAPVAVVCCSIVVNGLASRH